MEILAKPFPLAARSAVFTIAAALAIVLAPIWLSSALPANDLASHVYNAMVADHVRAGEQPFASRFELRRFPRSAFATDAVLGITGPVVGWETAERIWLSVIVGAGMLAYYSLLRNKMSPAWACAVSAWMANNWYAWEGFCDFAIASIVFAVFAAVLRDSRGRFPWLRVVVCLSLLYATHLFLFAVAAALLGGMLIWRAKHGQSRWIALAAVAPPLALLIRELTGPASQGRVHWTGLVGLSKAIAGTFVGDAVITFSWVSVLAGSVMMALVWSGLIQRNRNGRSFWQRDPMEIFAVAAFVGSWIVPDEIGAGSYTASRLRFAGVLALLPVMGDFRWPARRWVRFAPAALLLALAAQEAKVVRLGSVEALHNTQIEQALLAAGVKPGSWVSARLPTERSYVFRMQAFHYLAVPSYLRLGLCDLDDYEPRFGNFEVQWKRRPDQLASVERPSGIELSLQRGDAGWDGGLWLLHDSGQTVASEDPTLSIGPTTVEGPYSVTRITLAGR